MAKQKNDVISENQKLFDTYPYATVLHICYPQGLDQGVYQMEFRLIDPTYVIYTRQWGLTVE